MPFGQSTPRRMDLAAFPLGELEEHRPGVFRHRDSISARVSRWFERPAVEPEPVDMFAWHSVEDLMRAPR